MADSAAVMREVARVLHPGGRWVFATTHPIRWAFPDDPGPAGLCATMPYWDRTPYVEFARDGTPVYVEHHRTLGDRVRELADAGFRLVDFVEPEWPAGHTQEWGQWSPLRGAILPGTAIYVCELNCAMTSRPATADDIPAIADLDRRWETCPARRRRDERGRGTRTDRWHRFAGRGHRAHRRR